MDFVGDLKAFLAGQGCAQHYIAKELVSQAEQLFRKLNRQSEQLALALKEKNDAVEALAKALNRVPTMFLANDGLMGALHRWDQDWTAMRKHVSKLEAELKELKPPEPKFRVGQVVGLLVPSSGFVRVDATRLQGTQHQYWSKYTSWWYDENALRALEEQEK